MKELYVATSRNGQQINAIAFPDVAAAANSDCYLIRLASATIQSLAVPAGAQLARFMFSSGDDVYVSPSSTLDTDFVAIAAGSQGALQTELNPDIRILRLINTTTNKLTPLTTLYFYSLTTSYVVVTFHTYDGIIGAR